MPKLKTKQKRQYVVDKIILAVAILEPICTLPQAIGIYRDKDASGISILTWVGFNILTIIWIWYAITHKEKIVLIYQSLFFIFDTLLIVGAIMYGGQWL
jgi:uncharacterized protein with PQ loop repeat